MGQVRSVEPFVQLSFGGVSVEKVVQHASNTDQTDPVLHEQQCSLYADLCWRDAVCGNSVDAGRRRPL